jgi:hypothetical protein
MAGAFPTPERNALIKQLALDPRWAKQRQERPKVPLVPPAPKSYRRVACSHATWDLPRTLRRYEIQQDSGIGGKATKWVVRGPGGEDDFYIAKFGNKNGHIEILTELFNNRLGVALGCEMAHSGIARLDGHLYFITRNFRRSQELIHGSLMIENTFSAKSELDRISPKSEQSFYSIDFIVEVFRQYCGNAAESVLNKFFEMLVFDAFIGSMDRHAKNWGVLRSGFSAPVNAGAKYRLAPIFDSARALLWDLPEGKLLLPDNDYGEIVRYAETSCPCIGPP